MKSWRFFLVAGAGLTALFCGVGADVLWAQKKAAPQKKFDDDSLIVFQPARPFIEKVETTRRLTNGFAANLVFSGNGFALGASYRRDISPAVSAFFDFIVSGRQNSDEIEVADSRFQRYVVPEKVNRLFVMPLMFGATYRLVDFEIIESVKPFFQAGLGPALILAAPYIRDNRYYDFFSSLGEAATYWRFGGFVGAGLNLPTVGATATSAFTVRYYFIPFGGDGLESMNSLTTPILPIKDFGGLFFTVSIGFKF